MLANELKDILDIIEECQDIFAYDQAKIQSSDPISFTQALKELKK